ncbi:hypothetical protein ACLESD_17055 [Pyxidicoccus sp. 3LFB2]
MAADEGTVLYFGEQVLGKRLILRPDRDGPDPVYLRYHYENVFLNRLTAM